MYSLTKCPNPTAGLHNAPSPAVGQTRPDAFFKCYKISPNILIRPLNLTSAHFGKQVITSIDFKTLIWWFWNNSTCLIIIQSLLSILVLLRHILRPKRGQQFQTIVDICRCVLAILNASFICLCHFESGSSGSSNDSILKGLIQSLSLSLVYF